MVKRRTVDADVYVGTGNSLVHLQDLLSLQIAGTATITNEARLGQRDEEASCHAVAVAVTLTNMYDGADTVALRALSGSASNVAVVTAENFECYPADVPELPQAAPQDQPITSTLTFAQSGRGKYGQTVHAFTLAGTGATLSETVDLTGVTSVHVVVTSVSGAGDFDIGTSGSHEDIPLSVGVHEVQIPTSGRTDAARIARSAAGAEGYVLIGEDQPLAADA